LTSDSWILHTVQGLKVDFVNAPIQVNPRITPSFGIQRNKIIQDEVDTLLSKGAIAPVDPVKGQFISTIFLVDKKSGGKRPVINLKSLNQFVDTKHFKMSGLKTVLSQIKQGDLLFTLDLSDAYFSIPIQADFKKYFRFIWKGQIYEFQVMPFGLSSAPWIFTKVTKPLMAFLHSRGLRSSIYIDDCIGMVQNHDLVNVHRDLMVKTFQDVGFVINFKKSSLVPEFRKIYLGFIIDTMLMKVFLSQEKLQCVIKIISDVFNRKVIKIKDLASVIGVIVAVFPAVYQGPLHYRTLETYKTQQLKVHRSFKARIVLTGSVKKELLWWINNIQECNGKDIHPPVVDMVCRTDASLFGWGAICETKMLSGTWDQSHAALHINVLEMLALRAALFHFTQCTHNIHIQFQVDNTTVVTYINRMGGTHSPVLNSLAQEIWTWCIGRKIHVSAIHIAGKVNTQADYLSRWTRDRAGWMLDRDVFQQLCRRLFFPQVDLFATCHNCQVVKFVSWKVDPWAWKINAFSVNWKDLNAYAFPPFILIDKVLLKVREEKSRIMLITPNWPAQGWWPTVLEMSVTDPLLIPPSQGLLRLPPQGTDHPLAGTLSLIAWIVSGNITESINYRRDLQTSLSLHGEQELAVNTRLLGLDGVVGVVEGKLIPLRRL